MRVPGWACVFMLWLATLGLAASAGVFWVWTPAVIGGVAVAWMIAWNVTIGLHRFLVPKEGHDG